MAKITKGTADKKPSGAKKDKSTSGGGKDQNNGGAPAKKSTAGGIGETGGTKGTQ